jgi:IS30 family transposase
VEKLKMGTQYIQPYKKEKILMLAQHCPPLSYREIAEQVGVCEVTVRRTVQRAGIKEKSAPMGPRSTITDSTPARKPRKGSRPPEFSEREKNSDYRSIVDRFDRTTGELITAPPDYSGYKITKL